MKFVKEHLLLASGVFFCSAVIFFLIGGLKAEAYEPYDQPFDPPPDVWVTGFSNQTMAGDQSICGTLNTSLNPWNLGTEYLCEIPWDSLATSTAVIFGGADIYIRNQSGGNRSFELSVAYGFYDEDLNRISGGTSGSVCTSQSASNGYEGWLTIPCNFTTSNTSVKYVSLWVWPVRDSGIGTNASGMHTGWRISPNWYDHYESDQTDQVLMLRNTISDMTGIDPFHIPNPYGTDETYINITAPTSTTASRTFDVDFNYRMESSYPQASEYTHILFTLCARSYSNDECLKFSAPVDTLGSAHSDTLEIMAERDGYHLLLANFWNGVSEDTTCSWWQFFCEEETALIGVGTSVNFNVATTTIDADVPEWILNGDFCGEMDGLVDSAMCNALAFLFVPDSASLDKIFTLDDVLAQKQPFGFFFLVQKKMTEVGETTGEAGSGLTVDTGEGALGEIEFFNFASAKSEMTDMGMDTTEVQDIMIWMLWLMLGWYVWYRTMTVSNPTAPKQLNLIGQEV